jgi:hypothetical protein
VTKRALALFAVGFGVTLVTACGGSSGTPPHVAPSSSPSATLETAATAVRQMTQLALGTLHATLLLQRIVRPGLSPLLTVPANANAAPVCDAPSATAYQAAPTVTQSGTRVVATFYPAGDTACASSPLGVLVYVVPARTAVPYLVVGYLAEYAQAGSDVSEGAAVNFEPFNAEVNDVSRGAVEVEIQSAPENLAQGGSVLPAAPAAGTFPSTFPTMLPDPPASAGYMDDVIVAEGSAGTQVSYISYLGAVPNAQNPALSLEIITIDDLLTTVTPQSGGARSLSSLSRGALASTDLPQSPTAFAPSPFPAAPGFATFSIPPADISAKAVIASLPNYGTRIVQSGVFSENGWPASLTIHYTDSATKVSVSLSTDDDGTTYDLTATDLVDGSPLLRVSPLRIDAGGSSARTNFNLDGTPFQTGQFAVTD